MRLPHRGPRHALARLGELARRIGRLHHRIGFGVMVAGDAEGRRDAVGGDVVMGRPDPAGG